MKTICTLYYVFTCPMSILILMGCGAFGAFWGVTFGSIFEFFFNLSFLAIAKCTTGVCLALGMIFLFYIGLTEKKELQIIPPQE